MDIDSWIPVFLKLFKCLWPDFSTFPEIHGKTDKDPLRLIDFMYVLRNLSWIVAAVKEKEALVKWLFCP